MGWKLGTGLAVIVSLTSTLAYPATVSLAEDDFLNFTANRYFVETDVDVNFTVPANQTSAFNNTYFLRLKDPRDKIDVGRFSVNLNISATGSQARAQRGATQTHTLIGSVTGTDLPTLSGSAIEISECEEEVCVPETSTYISQPFIDGRAFPGKSSQGGVISAEVTHSQSGNYQGFGDIQISGTATVWASAIPISDVKARFTAMADGLESVRNVITAGSLYRNAQSASTEAEALNVAIDAARETLNAAVPNNSNPRVDTARNVISDVAGALTAISLNANPVGVARTLTADLGLTLLEGSLREWAADPPNFNYRTTLERPELSNIFSVISETDSVLLGTQDLLDSAVTQLLALDSYELFQGAYLDYLLTGDPTALEWAEFHYQFTLELLGEATEQREAGISRYLESASLFGANTEEGQYFSLLGETYQSTYSTSISAVPLPSTASLMLGILIFLGFFRNGHKTKFGCLHRPRILAP